jgi:hypothetical protein
MWISLLLSLLYFLDVGLMISCVYSHICSVKGFYPEPTVTSGMLEADVKRAPKEEN